MALFEVNVPINKDSESRKYITKLKRSGFERDNKNYVNNYIDSNIAVVYKHIKMSYERFVIDEGWDERKFDYLVKAILHYNKTMVPGTFEYYGKLYNKAKNYKR